MHSVLFSFEKIFRFKNCSCSFSIISESCRLLYLDLHCLLRSKSRFAVQKRNKQPRQRGLHCTIPYSRKNPFSMPKLRSVIYCYFVYFLKGGWKKDTGCLATTTHQPIRNTGSRLYLIHGRFYVP